MCERENFVPVGLHVALILNRLRNEAQLRKLRTDDGGVEIQAQAPHSGDKAGAGKEGRDRIAEVNGVQQSDDQIQNPVKEIASHSAHHAGENDPQEQDKPAQTADEKKEESHRRFVMQRVRDFAEFERRFIWNPDRPRRTKIND